MISHETEDQEVHNKETAEDTQAEIARLIHEFKKEKRENGRIVLEDSGNGSCQEMGHYAVEIGIRSGRRRERETGPGTRGSNGEGGDGLV
jgi:hypothetical protein